MRTVVAIAIGAWALWWAHRDPNQGRGGGRSGAVRATCSTCYGRNTCNIIVGIPREGIGTHCFTCKKTFSIKYDEAK